MLVKAREDDLVEEGRVCCVRGVCEAIFILESVWLKKKLDFTRALTFNHQVVVAMCTVRDKYLFAGSYFQVSIDSQG